MAGAANRVNMDEAHKLKNRKSKSYQAFKTIDTRLRYGLTGTAMQNNHAELFYLLDMMCPGKFGEFTEFKAYYVDAFQQAQRRTCNDFELARGKQRGEHFKQLIAGYLLRRTKEGTIKGELPKKTDNIIFCPMTPIQLRTYRRLLGLPDIQLLAQGMTDCGCGSGHKRFRCCHTSAPEAQGGIIWPYYHECPCDWAFDRISRPHGCKHHKPEGCGSCPLCIMFPCINIMRRVANHPKLLQVVPPKEVDDPMQRDLNELEAEYRERLAELAYGEDADALGGLAIDNNFARNSSAEACGKVGVLLRLLALWACEPGGNKVLLFSHSVRMLDLVESMMLVAGYRWVRLDGSTKREDRQRAVDEFNHSPSVFLFLVSTQAGGLGLNLTAANNLGPSLICALRQDPSWNPAHDLQAQDRAFRIGQARDVAVYRLIATGTLEELIYMRQIYKQQQTNVAVEGADETRYFLGVQGSRGQQGELWGLVNLFRDHLDVLETHQVFGDTHAAEEFRIEAADFGGLAFDEGDAEEAAAAAEMGLRDDADDAGLSALARASAFPDIREAPRGVRGAAAARRAAGRQGSEDEDAEDEEDDNEYELEQLTEAGIVGMHQHNAVLGASASEAAIAVRARRLAAAALRDERPPAPLDPPARSTADIGAAEAARLGICLPPSFATDRRAAEGAAPRVLNLVESLAAWRNMDVRAMAERLLGMSEEQLTEERNAYVAAGGSGNCHAPLAAC